MENKREAEGRAKLKAAMIDAALEHERRIDQDAMLEKIVEEGGAPFDLLMYKLFEGAETDVDPSGTPLAPGRPEYCLGSGGREHFECCCDNCPHFLKCFPDTLKQKNAT